MCYFDVIARMLRNVYTEAMTSSTLMIPSLKLPLSRRNVALIIATLLLHLIALQSTGWKEWSVQKQPGAEKIIHISLRPKPDIVPPTAVSVAPQQGASAPDTKQKAEKKAAEIIAPAINQDAKFALETTTITPAEVSLASDAPTTSVSTQLAKREEPSAEVAASMIPTTAPAPAPAPASYAVRAPESVHISMALVRTKLDFSQSYGVGSISWDVNNGKYSMRIEAGIDMLITSINLYQLTSEGSLGAFGIAPDTSTETRRTRASTATHFHQEEKTISFSSSNKIVAMDNGAQDKASFLMQLAAIGYADERQFFPGQEIAMQVAEERDATPFQFLVLAKEEITSKLGKIMAWHLVRAPRPGSYNSQLDIWLAPELGWYPIQIRNTESNGIVTVQTATKIMQKTHQDN